MKIRPLFFFLGIQRNPKFLKKIKEKRCISISKFRNFFPPLRNPVVVEEGRINETRGR